MGGRGAAAPADRLIATLAGRQKGVASRRQLMALGLSPDQIDHRIASGRLHPLYRGAYAVGHTAVSWEGRCLAATMTCGPGAAVSVRAAGALNLLRPSSATAVDVSVPGRRRGQPGLVLHHPRRLEPADITTVRGIPVTTAMRTLADLAAILDADGLARAVKQAERLRLLDVRTLEPHMRRGCRGTANLRAVLAELDEDVMTRQELERLFFRLTKRAGLPTPQCNVPLDRFVVDFLWPCHNLVVETDGWQDHGTRRAFEDDRARDVVLAQRGLRVVRFTWRQVQREPDAVADALRRLVTASEKAASPAAR